MKFRWTIFSSSSGAVKGTLRCTTICALLAACGGGGSGTTPAAEYHDLADATFSGTTAVRTISISIGSGPTSGNSNFQNSSRLLLLEGADILMSDTGLAEGMENVLQVEPSNASLAGDLQLIIQTTDPRYLPTSGATTYDGKAYVVIADSSEYSGEMQSSATVSFGRTSASVDLILSNFSPDSDTLKEYEANGSELIRILSMDREGSIISSGDATSIVASGWNGSSENLLLGDIAISFEGAIGGKLASEIGGAGLATGADGGSVLIIFTGH